MIKKYAYWIMLLSIIGCKSSQSIVGNYSSVGKWMRGKYLFIKEDGAFEYYEYDELYPTSYGTWQLSNKEDLVLKSDESLRCGVLDFIEEIDSLTERLTIKLIDENKESLPGAAVTVNEPSKRKGFNVDENGYGSYEISDLKFLTIGYLGVEYEYVLTNPKANKLILTIRLQTGETIFLNDELLKVRRKSIYWGDGKGEEELKFRRSKRIKVRPRYPPPP